MLIRKKGRSGLNWVLFLIILLSINISAFAQEGGPTPDDSLQLVEDSQFSVQVDKSITLDLSLFESYSVDPATGEPLLNAVVLLEDPSLVNYQGHIPGLPATSPRATGARQVNPRSQASQSYMAYLRGKHANFEQAVDRVAPSAQISHTYTAALNGVALAAPASQLQAIANLPGVARVLPDLLQQPDTEVSPEFVGAPTVWNMLGGQGSAGEGVIVGVLDTGIWPEHPSFSDPDPSGKPFASPAGGPFACQFGSAIPGDEPFTCNNKLIGAYRFMATYDLFGPPLLPGEFLSARDDVGHGTHTTSTAAGNAGVEAHLLGIDRGVVSGIAPRAHVIMYKVCGDAGCFQSDSVAAVNQSILDGVDAINFSISGGANPYVDVVELAFLNAYNNSVFVSASAGNAGPGPDTVAHRGPWVMTVGASTTDRHFLSTITLEADSGETLVLTGASVTDGITTSTPVIFPPAGQELCLTPFPEGTFDGEIVICERGIIARVEKSYNLMVGGAGGMIQYNPTLQGLATDNHFIPSVHIENDAGADLLAFMSAQTGVTATFTAGIASTVQGDVMAAFSSRGGAGQTLGVSKPDITAPGVQILAGHSPMPATVVGGSPGELFQAIQGTSMSSPHMAGAGALIKALRPDWTPGQIKSALMSTALAAGVTKEDGSTPADAFDFGSGRLDLSRAGNPGLTISATAEDFVLFQNDLWNANYPSLYIPRMPGVLTVSRTVKSELSTGTSWSLSVDAPSDLRISVPNNLGVPPGAEVTFNITIDARNVPTGAVRHATLTLQNADRVFRFPITIVKQQAEALLDKTCDPAVFPRGSTTECIITIVNTSFEDISVSLVDHLPNALQLVRGSVVGGTERGNSVFFEGTLAAADPPDVSISSGNAPFGYFPLTSAPVAGVGDESLVNFTLPAAVAFTYGGESYTRVGMVSNGYLVVGGGAGADIQFINQNLPDPAPPNNVLAPFWTDLNPADGGTLRAQILGSGANLWTVFEWRDVPNWSNSSQINTFQVWVPAATNTGDPAFTEITYAYGPVLTAGDGGFLTVGAENLFGNRGENLYFDGFGTLPVPGTGAVVTSTPPTPGGVHTITFQATGVRTGAWTNCAEMTSPSFQGTSIACFSGEVTR